MQSRYFDARGRGVRDEDVLRDLLGRNRERAMQLLGVEKQAPPRRPFGIDTKLEVVDGQEVVSVVRAQGSES